MKRVLLTALIASVFLTYGAVLSYKNFVSAENSPVSTPDQATIDKYTSELLNGICSDHGGVNCSVINSDASIVCKDGTIDPTLPTIYAIPECKATIEELVTQQSDFMAKSGCFPPSELRCISETSYRNLSQKLNASGLLNSELGKSELSQCRQQISDYQKDLNYYKKCLSDNGKPDFELSGKITLPILKTIFCPLTYGKESFYDFNADLCLCPDGYFLNNGSCMKADLICQRKYSPQSYARKGNCILETSPGPQPAQPLQNKTDIISREINRIAFNTASRPSNTRDDLPEPSGANTGDIEEAYGPETEPESDNFIKKAWRTVINGFKKMLRLN